MHYRDSNKTSTFPAVTLKTRDREGLGGREDARGMDEREVRGMGGRRERTGREKGGREVETEKGGERGLDTHREDRDREGEG